MSFDEEKTYDDEISPLMTKIIAICKEHQIPMAATFQYCDREEDGAGYCTTTLPFAERASDRIKGIVAKMASNAEAVALAETIVTNPDGSRHITIRRVT